MTLSPSYHLGANSLLFKKGSLEESIRSLQKVCKHSQILSCCLQKLVGLSDLLLITKIVTYYVSDTSIKK